MYPNISAISRAHLHNQCELIDFYHLYRFIPVNQLRDVKYRFISILNSIEIIFLGNHASS